LAEQWTENLVIAPRDIFAPTHGCEHESPEKNKSDRGTVNMPSTALRVRRNGNDGIEQLLSKPVQERKKNEVT
jgi:hypothetical protein